MAEEREEDLAASSGLLARWRSLLQAPVVMRNSSYHSPVGFLLVAPLPGRLFRIFAPEIQTKKIDRCVRAYSALGYRPQAPAIIITGQIKSATD